MNIPLGENCVFNYIRGKNYSEAQKVANKLFRLDSSRKHYMAWWILCLVLQVRWVFLYVVGYRY